MAHYPPGMDYVPPKPSGGGGTVKVVLIVLAAIVLAGVLVCAGIFAAVNYAVQQARQLAADVSRQTLVDMVEQSEMEAEDKQAVIAQIDRVAADFKSGKITLEQVGQVMEELAQSPLFVLLMVRAAESKYVLPSGLSDEEKTQATLTLERVARGVFEKKIDPDSLDAALDPISTTDAQGQRQLKERVSDDELRAFLAECRKLADGAGMPAERFSVDIGDEIKRSVDRALSERALSDRDVNENR